MQYTANYGLKKPDGNDNYNVANDNGNMDAIDTQMKANATAAATAQTAANNAQTTANAAIPQTQIGAASGVAPLDASNKVPLANLPAMNYVPTSSEGVANGVATTDANNKVVQTANQSDKLSTARTISLSGDATGSATFDGSANETINVTLANSGVAAGTYPKVTVDGKGRVTAGSGLASADVTTALGFTPLSTAGTAANSNELNGQSASYYLAAAAQAADSAKLGGQPASYYQSSNGTWTPANGSLNVPASTVINIASVSSNANMFYVGYAGGYDPFGSTGGVVSPFMSGTSGSNGNTAWITSVSSSYGGDINQGYATTTTSNGTYMTVSDGGYSTQGYFRIYQGYLQFVTIQSGSVNVNAGNQFYWGVR